MRNWNFAQAGRLAAGNWDVSLPMRNWNIFHNDNREKKELPMLAYLWGIETESWWGRHERRNGDVSLPMRNWNLVGEGWVEGPAGDVSLPMRNWNLQRDVPLCRRSYDVSLPMRNWNSLASSKLCAGTCDVSLPMRNWNSPCILVNAALFRAMLAYLWGIETFNTHILDFPPFSDVSLPMRNWNCFPMCSPGFLCFDVSLPMRNWNRGNHLQHNIRQPRC